MNISTAEITDIEFCKVSSPASETVIEQLETFLLRIFEYGDYSFRTALSGGYCDKLNCTFFIARKKGNIVSTAGCLYSKENPEIALLSPVCTDIKFRRKGLSTSLCRLILRHLEAQGCLAIYLAAKKDNPAVNLYRKLGLEDYKGIVMRKLFCPKELLLEKYSGGGKTEIRRMNWADYPAVSALMVEPVDLYTFDFQQGLYSSKYFEPKRFLPVFPEMMNSFQKYGGSANLLLSNNGRFLAGIAHISGLPAEAQKHLAVMEYFVRDNFMDYAANLIKKTVEQSASLSAKKIITYCLECDYKKGEILKFLGAQKITVLPEYVRIDNKYSNVYIYEL